MALSDYAYQPIQPGPLSTVDIQPIAVTTPEMARQAAGAEYQSQVGNFQRAFDQQIGNSAKLRQQEIEVNTFNLLPPNATQFDVQALDNYLKMGGDVNDVVNPMTGKVDTVRLRESTQAKLYLQQTASQKQIVDKNAQEAERDIHAAFLSVPGGSQFITTPDGRLLSGPELFRKVNSPEGQRLLAQAQALKATRASGADKPEDVSSRNHSLATLEFLQQAKAAIEAPGDITGPLAGSAVGQGWAGLKAITGQALGKSDWANDREKQRVLEMVSKQNVLEAAKSMKGNLSNKDVAFLEQSVPTLSDTEDVWKWFLDLYERMLRANLETVKDPAKRGTYDFGSDFAAAPGPIKQRMNLGSSTVPGPVTGQPTVAGAPNTPTIPAAEGVPVSNQIYKQLNRKTGQSQYVIMVGPGQARLATDEELKAQGLK